jgi:hypothetical protein
MSRPVSSHGSRDDHRARGGGLNAVQAPLSGRRGTLRDDVTRFRQARPVDAIAVARKLVEEEA